MNFLTERFSMVCSPNEHVSVDEAMIPFKGRSSLKQYMPKKPVQHGIKVWMRADAESGYVSALEVYTGKKGDNIEQGLGSKVVLSLTEDLKNTYRHIYLTTSVVLVFSSIFSKLGYMAVEPLGLTGRVFLQS